MTQADWSEWLQRAVAAEVRRTRELLGLSVQQLADRCAEAGLEISRSTLSDWENGRRQRLPLAELIVLARALEVSPLQLIVPVGRTESFEILPGEQHATWSAARWFSGEMNAWQLDGKPEPDIPGEWRAEWPVSPFLPLPAFRHHDALLREWDEATAASPPREMRPDLAATALEMFAARVRRVERDLGRLRREMRRQGLLPPPLPADVAHVDEVPEWAPPPEERRRYRPR